MTDFNVHTIETASDASKPLLEDSKKAFGFVPNLHAVMAESPALLEAYKTVADSTLKTQMTNMNMKQVNLAIILVAIGLSGSNALAQNSDSATTPPSKQASPMPRPKIIVFDVNETLLDLAPLKTSIGHVLGGREEPKWRQGR